MLPQDLLGGVVVEVVEVAAGPSALPSRLETLLESPWWPNMKGLVVGSPRTQDLLLVD